MRTLFISLFVVLAATFANAGSKHEHHHHKSVDATAPYPTIVLEVQKDAKDGYNLKIATTNFSFTPEAVNQENNGNEGHAHIYINGEKIRQYSPYFHLSAKLLKDGENEIRVSLHANDHGHLVIEGKNIEATVTVSK